MTNRNVCKNCGALEDEIARLRADLKETRNALEWAQDNLDAEAKSQLRAVANINRNHPHLLETLRTLAEKAHDPATCTFCEDGDCRFMKPIPHSQQDSASKEGV